MTNPSFEGLFAERSCLELECMQHFLVGFAAEA